MTVSSTSWRDVREVGSVYGMLFTVKVYRWFGLWVAEPVLWGVAAYFFLKDGSMRRISKRYLQKIDPSRGWIDVYSHYLSFARTSLDRFDVWSDRLSTYTFHYHGEENLAQLLKAHQGAVLLGAHLGNFDTLRALAKRRGGKVHILTDRRNSQKFSAILRRFCPQMDEGVIEYDAQSMETIFELKRAVERGEFVGLLGDRIAGESARGAGRVSAAVFLGESAFFPQAPFLFAGLLECPVLLLFALRRSSRVYDFYVEPFADRINLNDGPREECLGGYVAAYAARLESYCRRYPLQWFNFFDFWRKPQRSSDRLRLHR